MKKKSLSMLLYSSCAIAIVYFIIVFASNSHFTNASDALYHPTSTNSVVEIIEFNDSEFCLKNYSKDDFSESGEALYNKNCVFCHTTNTDGTLDMLALDEVVDRLGQERVLDVVKHGRNEMPVYGFVLSDEEIKVISQYLKQLHSTVQ